MPYTNYRFMSIWFAQALAERRGEMDLRTAAKECGVSASTLSRLEAYRTPDVPTLLRLCSWLQRPVSDFVLDVAVSLPEHPCTTKPVQVAPRRVYHKS